jgi:hypothetical protein
MNSRFCDDFMDWIEQPKKFTGNWRCEIYSLHISGLYFK